MTSGKENNDDRTKRMEQAFAEAKRIAALPLPERLLATEDDALAAVA